MTKVRVHSFGMSIDGFGAGVHQSHENPLGLRGLELHEWVFKTQTFQAMVGNSGGSTGTDNDFAARGFDNIGAWIIGRNMFGPIRGEWPDDAWRGWWGDDPPYHTPVFVLTHHGRSAIVMAGGTTFFFVTDGIDDALARAVDASNGKDVRLGGGVATIRQYLQARLIDEMHLAYTPVTLGSGESLFAGIDLPSLGYRVSAHVTTTDVMHLRIARNQP